MARFRKDGVTAAPGTDVLVQGLVSPHLFTILSGLGLRTRDLSNGRCQVVGFVLPGDFLGLQPDMVGPMEYPVVSRTEMRLCVFDRGALLELFRANPERGFRIAHVATTESSMLAETLTTVGQLGARERIAWAFARLHVHMIALNMGDPDGSVPLPSRQRDLADALGLSLVHVKKTLTKLRAEGIASWIGGRLHDADPPRLYDLGHVDPTPPGGRPLLQPGVPRAGALGPGSAFRSRPGARCRRPRAERPRSAARGRVYCADVWPVRGRGVGLPAGSCPGPGRFTHRPFRRHCPVRRGQRPLHTGMKVPVPRAAPDRSRDRKTPKEGDEPGVKAMMTGLAATVVIAGGDPGEHGARAGSGGSPRRD